MDGDGLSLAHGLPFPVWGRSWSGPMIFYPTGQRIPAFSGTGPLRFFPFYQPVFLLLISTACAWRVWADLLLHPHPLCNHHSLSLNVPPHTHPTDEMLHLAKKVKKLMAVRAQRQILLQFANKGSAKLEFNILSRLGS